MSIGPLLIAVGALILMSKGSRGPTVKPSEQQGLTAFRLKQQWPGARESAYVEKSQGYSKRADLIENRNPRIVFKNEEGTGADRFMTPKLNHAMNQLAELTQREWPGVSVRVTEAWDEDREHSAGSTHYEGRGADLTTSDRDLSKLGMLAALAAASGFEWVYFEDDHIHVSVNP